MAYVYDNKTYRNLQQQVKENMDNIAELQEMKLVGLDVAGIVADYGSLPSSAQQGQVYAVGTSSPYELYVYNDSSWVDFGQFPKAGPQGEQGPQGEPGRQGQRGLTGPQGPRGYTGAPGTPGKAGAQGEKGTKGDKGDKGDTGLVDAFAKDAASITAVGQAYVDANGYLQVCTSLSPLTFEQGGYIKGAQGEQGIQGLEGPQGPEGPEGPMGPKGEKGEPGLTTSIEVNGQTYYLDNTGKITLPDYPEEIVWGNIKGTLSSQTDLQTALNAKQNVISDLSDIREGAALGKTSIQQNVLPTLVNTNTEQTITGKKTFNGKVSFGDKDGNGVGGIIYGYVSSQPEIGPSMTLSSSKNEINKYNSYIILKSSSGGYETSNSPYILFKGDLWPHGDSMFDIGVGFNRIKDLYISGNLTDGTAANRISVANIASKSEIQKIQSALNTKQDVISDLVTIRSGAEAGTTAVQPAELSEYAKTSELATVATSGSYNDLTDKPTIPTKTSQLTNDSNFVTSTELATKQDKLVAGTNITIEGNVISATGGSSGGGSGGEIFIGTSITSKSDWDAAYLANKQLYLDRNGILAPLGLTIGGSETVAPGTYFFSGFGNGTYAVCYRIDQSGFSEMIQGFLQEQLTAGEGISIVGNTISAATVSKNKYNVYLYDNSNNSILASKLIETSVDLTQGQQYYDISLSDLYNALLEDETGSTKSITNPILFNFTLNPEFVFNNFPRFNDMIELTAHMDRNSGQYSYYKRYISSGQNVNYSNIDDIISIYFTLKAEKVINN